MLYSFNCALPWELILKGAFYIPKMSSTKLNKGRTLNISFSKVGGEKRYVKYALCKSHRLSLNIKCCSQIAFLCLYFSLLLQHIYVAIFPVLWGLLNALATQWKRIQMRVLVDSVRLPNAQFFCVMKGRKEKMPGIPCGGCLLFDLETCVKWPLSSRERLAVFGF